VEADRWSYPASVPPAAETAANSTLTRMNPKTDWVNTPAKIASR
jgi:hypothetical protein